MMVDLASTQITPEEQHMLKHPLVGGVILFSRNYQSRDQLTDLVMQIKALRKPSLLLGVDHEGGRVQRFREGFTLLPPVGALGRLYDTDPYSAKVLAETTGWLMAKEVLAVGIDFSFAPVLDLDRGISTVIGDRAFHRDPQAVVELAGSYIRGMARAGMTATGKHFPGHGMVVEDSHHALPVDKRHYDQIAAEDLIPFARLIHFGLGAIMPAHVIYQNVDENPAGFSEFWIKEVLRNRLGFRGTVFSDDLSMKAAYCMGDFGERALKAIQAGCDMVLVCNDHQAVAAVLQALDRYKSEPGSIMRRMRMVGRSFLKWDHLVKDSKWKKAVQDVEVLRSQI